MSKIRMTISVPPEIASYLRSAPNASWLVSEAITHYRTKELERRLEAAYGEDSEESELLNREWEATESEIDE